MNIWSCIQGVCSRRVSGRNCRNSHLENQGRLKAGLPAQALSSSTLARLKLWSCPKRTTSTALMIALKFWVFFLFRMSNFSDRFKAILWTSIEAWRGRLAQRSARKAYAKLGAEGVRQAWRGRNGLRYKRDSCYTFTYSVMACCILVLALLISLVLFSLLL